MNKNLHLAKKAKNDEFYTQISDIENELFYYRDHFKGKAIFLNCDDPTSSHFWKFFELNFKFLGLKKLISTHYHDSECTYKLEIVGDLNNDGVVNDMDIIKTSLKGNGDFRSPESVEILKDADIVVTNPPFSLFRDFISLMMEHDRKFLVIGNMNAITYKEIFKHIKNNEMWLGVNSPKNFVQPDGTIKKFGNICWFTNLDHKKRNEELFLYKTHEGNEELYPKYDNYDAIEVSKTKDIPCDYNGVMGVPISFLVKYNPDQVEIVGNADDKDFYIPIFNKYSGRIAINGVQPYKRIFIKKV